MQPTQAGTSISGASIYPNHNIAPQLMQPSIAGTSAAAAFIQPGNTIASQPGQPSIAGASAAANAPFIRNNILPVHSDPIRTGGNSQQPTNGTSFLNAPTNAVYPGQQLTSTGTSFPAISVAATLPSVTTAAGEMPVLMPCSQQPVYYGPGSLQTSTNYNMNPNQQ